MADHTRVTRLRTGSALALLLACALMCAPAAAHASLAGKIVFHAAGTPDDPKYDHQWGLENAGGGPGAVFPTAVEDSDIDAQQAWDDPDSGQGSGVTVAVVDTRIDASNTDLAPQLVSGTPAWPDPQNPSSCPANTPPA